MGETLVRDSRLMAGEQARGENGSAWVQDAFTQVELVLASLKLAVEFLRPGGTF
jgi:23S rRNA U2552 (ribose-2'-O)-methylase RlmE/FtsJ